MNQALEEKLDFPITNGKGIVHFAGVELEPVTPEEALAAFAKGSRFTPLVSDIKRVLQATIPATDGKVDGRKSSVVFGTVKEARDYAKLLTKAAKELGWKTHFAAKDNESATRFVTRITPENGGYRAVIFRTQH